MLLLQSGHLVRLALRPKNTGIRNMKIEDIENNLPNGFHDAFIKNVNIDYSENIVTFNMEVLSNNPDIDKENNYKGGKLILKRVLYCAIEPPDDNYLKKDLESLRIDAGTLDSLETKPMTTLPKTIPEDAFSHWFFVQQWNAFIYVAAFDADFFWE